MADQNLQLRQVGRIQTYCDQFAQLSRPASHNLNHDDKRPTAESSAAQYVFLRLRAESYSRSPNRSRAAALSIYREKDQIMSATRPPYSLFPVIVERIQFVTPHVKRITIDGSCLPDFRAELPAQWLKVFVPTTDGGDNRGRAYTVRHFDPASKKLDLDFVLHGDNGVASAWAARARVGDTFEISGTHPRSGLPIKGSTDRYLLFGDETALPAIGAVLEALPAYAYADVFVEVADTGEKQSIDTAACVNLTWLYRESSEHAESGSLEQAAQSFNLRNANTLIWVAAESSTVESIRKHVLGKWGCDRTRLHAAGYWESGKSGSPRKSST